MDSDKEVDVNDTESPRDYIGTSSESTSISRLSKVVTIYCVVINVPFSYNYRFTKRKGVLYFVLRKGNKHFIVRFIQCHGHRQDFQRGGRIELHRAPSLCEFRKSCWGVPIVERNG